MRISWWTQKRKYTCALPGTAPAALENLLTYYQASSKTFRLVRKDEKSFIFTRGRKWFSAVGVGSERCAYHQVEVRTKQLENGTRVDWDIDLKWFGLQFATNAILDECKQIGEAELKIHRAALWASDQYEKSSLPRIVYIKTRFFNFRLLLLFCFLFSVLFNSVIPLRQWYAFTSWSTEDGVISGFFIEIPSVLCIMASLGFIPILLITLIPVKNRKTVLILLCLCLVNVCVGRLMIKWSHHIHDEALRDFIKRSKPLITAIRQYEKVNGHPPTTITSLAPKYIPQFPATGWGAFPNYEYSTSKHDANGNPWVLSVLFQWDIFKVDELLYYPNQNYSDYHFMYYMREIEGWGYVNLN